MNRIQYTCGTQYYRAPTPLPEEWSGDLDNVVALGLNAIQIRVQWRQNERLENQYEFGDVDRLFDLAEARGLPVIVKLLLENAPDYIFEKYHGDRYGLHGQKLRPGAHGAFYVGGWMPCFDNSLVQKRAVKFVEQVVTRYRNRPNLLHWNAWNEPRSKPIDDCCCPYSVASFRRYLKDRFGTIEALNREFGKCWESFETVQVPAMPHDYAELFLWRRWSTHALYERLKVVRDAIRRCDITHPVMSHVGGCNVLQDACGDCSDDILNASLFDFYGTSFPLPDTFPRPVDQCLPFMTCAWMHEVCRRFWIYEIYPEWGDWGDVSRPEDFTFKVMACVASGAKGLLYWQYRAERLGMENDLAGLVNIDGSPKPVTEAARQINVSLREHEAFLLDAEPVYDPVGILYSQDSDLMSRIEGTGVGVSDLRDFELRGKYTYKFNLQGVYSLFNEAGYAPRWLDERKLEEEIQLVRVLYLPEYYIIPDRVLPLLEDFVGKGGTLIAEEGLGLRDGRTWLHYPWPGGNDSGLGSLFGVKGIKRFARDKVKALPFEHEELLGDYFMRLEVESGTEVLLTDHGEPLVTRKGNAVFVATDLGTAVFRQGKNSELMRKLLAGIMPVEPGFATGCCGVYRRELVRENRHCSFVFNQSDEPYVFGGKTIESGCSRLFMDC